ncbi:MAG: hypothetical protein GWO85_01535, partial [Simkaniaceae bacterium]|nr:hypothetical protein [Simkaniaceae bacterium]
MNKQIYWPIAVFCGLLFFSSCTSPTKPKEIDKNTWVSYPDLKFGTDTTFEIGTWNVEHYPKTTTTNEYLA